MSRLHFNNKKSIISYSGPMLCMFQKAWVSVIEDSINSLLKHDHQQPRVKNSFLYLESSQI